MGGRTGEGVSFSFLENGEQEERAAAESAKAATVFFCMETGVKCRQEVYPEA